MFFLGRGRDDINNLALVSFNTPPDPTSLWLTHKDPTFNFKLYVGLLTVCPPKNMPNLTRCILYLTCYQEVQKAAREEVVLCSSNWLLAQP